MLQLSSTWEVTWHHIRAETTQLVFNMWVRKEVKVKTINLTLVHWGPHCQVHSLCCKQQHTLHQCQQQRADTDRFLHDSHCVKKPTMPPLLLSYPGLHRLNVQILPRAFNCLPSLLSSLYRNKAEHRTSLLVGGLTQQQGRPRLNLFLTVVLARAEIASHSQHCRGRKSRVTRHEIRGQQHHSE